MAYSKTMLYLVVGVWPDARVSFVNYLVVSHIQRIGYQPPNTTLHGGQYVVELHYTAVPASFII